MKQHMEFECLVLSFTHSCCVRLSLHCPWFVLPLQDTNLDAVDADMCSACLEDAVLTGFDAVSAGACVSEERNVSMLSTETEDCAHVKRWRLPTGLHGAKMFSLPQSVCFSYALFPLPRGFPVIDMIEEKTPWHTGWHSCFVCGLKSQLVTGHTAGLFSGVVNLFRHILRLC
jgi:hypothetical protein